MDVPESQIVVASIDDLMILILVRLPPRPLAQFKSVSKRWNSLVHLASTRTPNPAAGLILQCPFSHNPSAAFECPFRRRVSAPCAPLVVAIDKSSTSHDCRLLAAKNHSTDNWRLNMNSTFNESSPLDIRALSSCNGLLLCRFRDHSQRSYNVYNPTTGNYFTLPKLNRRKLAGICLAFDPVKSLHYSVVCVYRLDPFPFTSECRYELEVFSSETRCWIKTGEPFLARADFRCGVYWNGSVHWICSAEKSLYFNPNDSQTPPKPMPPPPFRNHTSFLPRHYFGESSGHLNFIENAYEWGGELIVHEMKDDYSEWFVKYRVDLSLWPIGNRFSLRGLVWGEKDEDSFFVFVSRRRLVRYNLVCKTLETICWFVKDGLESKSHYDSLMRRDFPLHYIKSICPV